MYDVRNKTAQVIFSTFFKDTSKFHTCNTRFSTSNKFYIERKSKLEIQEIFKLFSRIGAMVWNELPASLKELTKKQFKKRLHIALTEILQSCYDYVDITQISTSPRKAAILNNSFVISLSHMWLQHCPCFSLGKKLLLLRSKFVRLLLIMLLQSTSFLNRNVNNFSLAIFSFTLCVSDSCVNIC